MKARVRTREAYAAAGSRYRRSPELREGPFSYKNLDWRCEDFVEKSKSQLTGRTPPSNLMIRKSTIQPCFISYVHRFRATLENQYIDVPANMAGQASSAPSTGWPLLEGSSTELTAKLLADTNPFRYEVSVPIMISEFVEAASLLKLAANNFASLTGSAHLNWVFGWKPLIEDIKKLSTITKSVESRIKDFNALLEKGGITKRKHLVSTGSSDDEYERSIYSTGLGEWKGMVKTSYKTKVWGSVRWVPNRLELVDIQKLTEFNEALRVVLDLKEPDLATIWEATPWTWLIDYFVNVGDVLQAIESTDLVVPTEICLMRNRVVHTSTTFKSGPPSSGNHAKASSGSAGYVENVFLLREVREGSEWSDLLSFGFMSKSQATNLLALLLSLTRFKKPT